MEQETYSDMCVCGVIYDLYQKANYSLGNDPGHLYIGLAHHVGAAAANCRPVH